MDPSPPRNHRLRRPNGTAGASSSVSSTEYPILVPKTPAQIVSEAKEELVSVRLQSFPSGRVARERKA